MSRCVPSFETTMPCVMRQCSRRQGREGCAELQAVGGGRQGDRPLRRQLPRCRPRRAACRRVCLRHSQAIRARKERTGASMHCPPGSDEGGEDGSLPSCQARTLSPYLACSAFAAALVEQQQTMSAVAQLSLAPACAAQRQCASQRSGSVLAAPRLAAARAFAPASSSKAAARSSSLLVKVRRAGRLGQAQGVAQTAGAWCTRGRLAGGGRRRRRAACLSRPFTLFSSMFCLALQAAAAEAAAATEQRT